MSLDTAASRTKLFVQRYLNVLMLFFPVTSFLVIPAVQGTTIVTVFISILFGLLIFLPLEDSSKFKFFKELTQFLVVIFLMSVISQFTNLFYGIKLSDKLVLLNQTKMLDTFYRPSLITQTPYLVIGYITYLFVKYFSNGRTLEYIFWGIRLLCIYGLYEFVYYFITGQNGDFVTNRTFGEGIHLKSASLFQSMTVAGVTMLRIKGYTGEPSMFAFTVFPFWVLTFALKRNFDIILLSICLIFTFSTTAYLSMFAFLMVWLVYKKKFGLIGLLAIIGILMAYILQLEAFKNVVKGVYDAVIGEKLSGEGESANVRSGQAIDQLNFWSELNIVSKFTGIGFGYIRSTDFFSNVLVNTGIIGFVIFTLFVFKNFWLKILPADLKLSYICGSILMYLILMATVPEFAYASMWVYLSLGFLFQKGLHVPMDTEDDISIEQR